MTEIQNGNKQFIKKIQVSRLLSCIEKPSFQRDIDVSRISDIKSYLIEQKELYKYYPLIGIITLGKLKDKLYCIDGQHRLCAYKDLLDADSEVNVLIDERTIDNYSQLRDLFKKINQSVVVPDYLIFEENEEAKTTIKNGISNFKKKYETYFVKKSTSRKA